MFFKKAFFNGMNVPRAFIGRDLIFGKPIDFLAPYPDHRISVCLYADATGVRNWNSVNDQMPIKTINMAGLQKWEETDDYIIYLDKNSVMTTVEQYVTGSYDKFQEVKALVDTYTEMLVENGIEWTAEDDSKLFTDINDLMLEEIINRPTQLDKPTEIRTFTSKAVPTTYGCCFRTDKKNGEIYVGEGYENLVNGRIYCENENVKLESGKVVFLDDTSKSINFSRFKLSDVDSVIIGDKYSTTAIIREQNTQKLYTRSATSFFSCDIDGTFKVTGSADNVSFSNKTLKFTTEILATNQIYHGQVGFGETEREYTTAKKDDSFKLDVQVTKTATPKPFIKSIMPSGKLTFITTANSDTHTLITKDNSTFKVYTTS
ncbi:MAG: hypothetical protein ACRC0G_07060, partial [Fusobacteriaceae bacterium]